MTVFSCGEISPAPYDASNRISLLGLPLSIVPAALRYCFGGIGDIGALSNAETQIWRDGVLATNGITGGGRVNASFELGFQSIRPRRVAMATASVRDAAFRFAKIARRCPLTQSAVMPILDEMALLVSPLAA